MIILTGKPVSTNHAYKVTCRGKFATVYMTPQARKIKEEWALEAKSQHRKKPTTEDISITVRYYHKDKRKHDIDNYFKLLFDSLTGVVWEDDEQVVELIAQKYIDKENPRIEIIIN